MLSQLYVQTMKIVSVLSLILSHSFHYLEHDKLVLQNFLLCFKISFKDLRQNIGRFEFVIIRARKVLPLEKKQLNYRNKQNWC